jgi:hypothetical protein
MWQWADHSVQFRVADPRFDGGLDRRGPGKDLAACHRSGVSSVLDMGRQGHPAAAKSQAGGIVMNRTLLLLAIGALPGAGGMTFAV